MDHKFQIDLRGLIDLLSDHLYSGPEVFIRELLQNATDAIRARSLLDPHARGDIALEITHRPGAPPALVATDPGIGLTAEEMHRFLATIASSSKRDRPSDFIGRFGIGILSCFVVSDEIVVRSRSARESGPALEWRARPDGTYTLRELSVEMPAGTQVRLTAKPEHTKLFAPERVRELARHYGGLLPFPIWVTDGDHAVVVNENGAPWRQIFVSDKERTRALLAYGREMFNGIEFFDAILLRSEVGDVDGVAFVLPHRVHLSARRAHRVYLKNMLLSETADNLLPDWAVFVTAVVNANDLRPTASRESFYDDDKLHAARTALGGCLRNYLVNLARRDPETLQRFIAFHHLALKSLAVADEEFYALIMDWLPFETTQGEMTFGEYRKRRDTIRFAPTVDAFRQIARVAAAQGLCVINGGYVHEAELLSRAPLAFDGLHVEPVDPTTLTQEFDDLTREERVWADQLLTAADAALKPFRCATEARKFSPSEVPALFSTNGEGRFMRSLEQSRDVADPLWGGVLDSLGKPDRSAATARLCLNFQNPLVRRLAAVPNRTVLRQAVELLYVQALLLGHHPLSAKELALMGDGLLKLIELGIDAAGGKAIHG